MDELMNLMIADESPSEISDSIKNQLMQKAGARVDALKPAVANANVLSLEGIGRHADSAILKSLSLSASLCHRLRAGSCVE